ncbi:MAG: helix-turn-helix transcriptional regulator [Clostridia bacterium]
MKTDFSRIIANLRKEKKISQREAAEDLEISQALLSHYEKGMREPGLAFVVRAADYYNVSCDYLLSRSLNKHGSSLAANQIPDTSEDKDNVLTGSVIAMLQKKLILNSISMLIDLAGNTKNKELVAEVTSYFHLPIYKVYRYLSTQSVEDSNFSVTQEYFEPLCDAEQKISEIKIKSLTSSNNTFVPTENEVDLPCLSNENLLEMYPNHSTSLFSVLQSVSDKITITTNPKAKTKPKKKSAKKA